MFDPTCVEPSAMGENRAAHMRQENVLSRASDRWGTDRALVDRLRQEYQFDLDLAAEKPTAIPTSLWGPRYFGPDHPVEGCRDALTVDWLVYGTEGFLNPPFSLLSDFVAKAWEERCKGFCTVAVLPVKAEQPWWHTYVPLADELRFLKGRLRYIDPDTNVLGDSARFASAVVIWDGRKPNPINVKGGPKVSWWSWKT
jgi:hypothetical protein